MNQDPFAKLSQTLRVLRATRNSHKQGSIATELGLSQSAYSRLETDPSQLSLEKLQTIAKLHGKTMIELLGFDANVIVNKVSDTQTGGQGVIINHGTMNTADQSLEQRIKILEEKLGKLGLSE
jgi:transcriptional regulator with XRE-family HTH domain